MRRYSQSLPRLFGVVIVSSMVLPEIDRGPTKACVNIRGQAQNVLVYGQRGGQPIIVSSGDGGWIHLGPYVAKTLAANGFFVVGFDARAYLQSFTSAKRTLHADEEPGDYKVLVDFAARGSSAKPILIGVSEGAGLSVLAATEPRTKAGVAGVIGLGLPDQTELGWRWKDSVIYVTHTAPHEPSFSTAEVVDRMSPTPLAVIHSTQDEFVPVTEVRRVFQAAREPKRLWVVKASNHRFSDNLAEFDRRLLEAIAWITDNAAR